MNNNEEKIFQSLIQGEISALETYTQVLEKLESPAEKSRISTIYQNHKDALDQLKVYSKYKGVESPEDSGYWGTFAQGVTGTAKIFGETAAVKALKEGEKHGLNKYQEALESKEVGFVAKQFIKDKLIPNMELHINTLDAVMENN